MKIIPFIMGLMSAFAAMLSLYAAILVGMTPIGALVLSTVNVWGALAIVNLIYAFDKRL